MYNNETCTILFLIVRCISKDYCGLWWSRHNGKQRGCIQRPILGIRSRRKLGNNNIMYLGTYHKHSTMSLNII